MLGEAVVDPALGSCRHCLTLTVPCVGQSPELRAGGGCCRTASLWLLLVGHSGAWGRCLHGAPPGMGRLSHGAEALCPA